MKKIHCVLPLKIFFLANLKNFCHGRLLLVVKSKGQSLLQEEIIDYFYPGTLLSERLAQTSYILPAVYFRKAPVLIHMHLLNC